MKTLGLLMAVSVASLAHAAELSYSVTELLDRQGLDSARGLELRAAWGGEHGDAWSAWVGGVTARATSTGWLCHGGGCWEIDGFAPYRYVAVNRRWYARPGLRWKLYAGTGIGWRSHETCVDPPQFFVDGGERKQCLSGDLSVSSKWAFSAELGVVWRNTLDFSFGHFSTGGISEWNRGDNIVRLGFITRVGRRGHKEAQ